MGNYIDKIISADFFISETSIPLIDRFPKEFKKNWMQSIDFRFLSILAITFIIATVSVTYFSSRQFKKIGFVESTDLQKNFISLLIKDNFLNKSFNLQNKPKDTYLFGVFDKEENTKSEAQYKKEFVLSSNIRKRTALSNKNINRDTKARTSIPASVGILNLTTSNTRLTENPIDDILSIEQGSSLSLLEASIGSKVAPQSVGIIFSNNQKSGYKIKGNKTDQLASDDLKASLSIKEDIVSRVITKNIELEEIPTNNSPVTLKKKNDGETRSVQEVTKVILAHNRTIQDCYKQALKRESTVKGKIVVRFSVTSKGNVNDVNIINSSINDHKLEQCILNRIKRWNDFGSCDPLIGDIFYRQTYVFGF